MCGHYAQTIMIGMQDSLLVLEPSNRLISEHLKGTQPQSVVFDPNNPRLCILWHVW